MIIQYRAHGCRIMWDLTLGFGSGLWLGLRVWCLRRKECRGPNKLVASVCGRRPRIKGIHVIRMFLLKGFSIGSRPKPNFSHSVGS